MNNGMMSVSEKKQLAKRIGIILAAVLIIGAVFMAVMKMKAQSAVDTTYETQGRDDVIEIDGVSYVPKKNIETYLFMGIDNLGKVEKVEDFEGQGRCDVVMLLVRDLSTGTYKILNINRNTLMDQDSLLPDGTYLATTRAILALAHETGDGMEISCENVVKAVSNFLNGQKIDGYAAVNMGAISTINNLAGGVTVTIKDDFSKTDPTLVKGETIKLTDEQAMHFVHDRWYVSDGSNEERMERQKDYLEDLKIQLRHKCSEDNTYPMKIYESLSDYMVTNVSDQKFAKIAMLMLEDRDEGEFTIQGEVTYTEDVDYMEMEPDPASVQQAILELFYKPY